MRDLNGVIAATLTPFISHSGAVNEGWIPDHLRFLEQHGVDGVLTLGTTGEGPSLSLHERERVTDLVLEHRGQLSVMACTGCASLPETIALSRYVLARGVDAIVVMPPFFFKHVPEAGVLHYYRTLCNALPDTARVVLYHIPAVTGVPITPGIIEGLLASHPHQFYGIKDSSGDARYLTDLLHHHTQLHIFVGNELQAANGLQDGAVGIISALANVWPASVRAVVDAHPAQRTDLAAAQERLTTLFNVLPANTPPALKVVLTWVSNLPRTSVRVPLFDMSDAEAGQLRHKLTQAGLL
jgi:4-hydroxy-tetrahydrodipicolinate synthase